MKALRSYLKWMTTAVLLGIAAFCLGVLTHGLWDAFRIWDWLQ